MPDDALSDSELADLEYVKRSGLVRLDGSLVHRLLSAIAADRARLAAFAVELEEATYRRDKATSNAKLMHNLAKRRGEERDRLQTVLAAVANGARPGTEAQGLRGAYILDFAIVDRVRSLLEPRGRGAGPQCEFCGGPVNRPGLSDCADYHVWPPEGSREEGIPQ